MKRIIFHLTGDRTETVPVNDDAELPLIGVNDVFIHIEAADGSEVAFRANDILTMHLKEAA